MFARKVRQASIDLYIGDLSLERILIPKLLRRRTLFSLDLASQSESLNGFAIDFVAKGTR